MIQAARAILKDGKPIMAAIHDLSMEGFLMTSSYGSGYYAASAPRRRPPVFLIVLAVVLAGAAAAVYLRESRETATEAPPAAEEPILEPLEGAASAGDDREELLRENARLKQDVLRLEEILAGGDVDAVRELEDEVSRLRAELERHQVALKRAVDELNSLRRVASATAPPPPVQRSSRASAQPDTRGKWVFPRDPYAVMNPNRADVSGSVHNANAEPVKGFVLLKVLAGGREVADHQVRMEIPGKTVEEYSTVINGFFPQGPGYEVTATWVMAIE